MGMFDSMIDLVGDEWQTKALGNTLEVYHIDDRVPTYGDVQVEIFGGPDDEPYMASYATIRGGVLVAVHTDRDPSLPLLNIRGDVVHWGGTDESNGDAS